MTVTLHLPASPADRSAMLRRLVAIAGGRKPIRSGHGGLVVSDELALAYLADARVTGDAPARRPAMPPHLAQAVRTAEGRAGLLDRPTTTPAQTEPTPPKSRPAARRPRRQPQQQGAATS